MNLHKDLQFLITFPCHLRTYGPIAIMHYQKAHKLADGATGDWQITYPISARCCNTYHLTNSNEYFKLIFELYGYNRR